MSKNPINKKNYNNKYNSGDMKPKTITSVIPFICSGIDGKREYHVDTAIDLMKSISDAGVLNKISIDAKMAKAIAFNNDNIRGQISVGRVRSYDHESGNVSILFFGKNVAFADKITANTVLIPHVLTDKDGNVETFIGFELVEVGF